MVPFRSSPTHARPSLRPGPNRSRERSPAWAVASALPGGTVAATMPRSDFPDPVGVGFGLPSPAAYLRMRIGFQGGCRRYADRHAVEGLMTDVSVAVRAFRRRIGDLPGYRVVRGHAPKSGTPPGPTAPRPCRRRSIWPSWLASPWAPGKRVYGVGLPPAHDVARLRIDRPVAGTVARLATGPAGLRLDRTGLSPAGRRFHISERTHLLSSQWTGIAWSHRQAPCTDTRSVAVPGGTASRSRPACALHAFALMPQGARVGLSWRIFD